MIRIVIDVFYLIKKFLIYFYRKFLEVKKNLGKKTIANNHGK